LHNVASLENNKPEYAASHSNKGAFKVMGRKWKFALMAVILAAGLAVTACSKDNNTGQQTGGTTGTTTGGAAGGAAGGTTGGTTAANAETVAKQNCIACHGNALDGNGDSKKNLQTVGARLNKEQIATTIANGRNAMPAFKGRLKDDEITALADWLAAKK
jgi:cytochrome c551